MYRFYVILIVFINTESPVLIVVPIRHLVCQSFIILNQKLQMEFHKSKPCVMALRRNLEPVFSLQAHKLSITFFLQANLDTFLLISCLFAFILVLTLQAERRMLEKKL